MKKGHLNIALLRVWSLPVNYRAKKCTCKLSGSPGRARSLAKGKVQPPPPPSTQICYCSFDLGFVVHSVLNSMLSWEKQSFIQWTRQRKRYPFCFLVCFFFFLLYNLASFQACLQQSICPIELNILILQLHNPVFNSAQ